MFKKLLVANRGEIAVRVIRACRELGIRSVAVYSDADRGWPHVQLADEAYHVGPAAPVESYLNIERLIEIARASGCQAVHPGYGFLAERPEFAHACAEAGLTFVGPSPEAMALLGRKTDARRLAAEAGVPLPAGTDTAVVDVTEAGAIASRIGFPVLLKAVAGGGGKGMRVVQSAEELESALRVATNEARAAFGDGAVYVERLVERPRHVEVQVLADHHGEIVALGERECSVQRRHQKLIEEAPSPAVDGPLRERMCDAAVRIARAASYTNAGTVEFLLDQHGNFYFLEVNARIQVEHPVTELVAGLDLVQEQIRVAAGEPLGYRQVDVQLRGHAIECRISAEDPRNQFFPSTGRLEELVEPSGPGVRVDSGVSEGVEVALHYDPLLAKLIVWGQDREQACRRMLRALDEYQLLGVQTTIGFHRFVLEHRDFRAGRLDTGFVERLWGAGPEPDETTLRQAAVIAALAVDRERSRPVSTPAQDRDGSAWRELGRRAALRSR